MRSLVNPIVGSVDAKTPLRLQHPQAQLTSIQAIRVPKGFEYAFYGLVCYSAYGAVLGLHIRFFVPALTVLLAMICLMHLGPKIPAALGPIALPLACGVSFLAIQLGWHGESLLPGIDASRPEGQLRFHAVWLLGLIVMQTLSLNPGFLHRFALVSFVSGVGLLRYLKLYQYTDTIVRLGLEGVGRDNPNHLGMWGGFCAIYFFVLGIETSRTVVRVASWLIGVGCLYIVALTVSRGPLFAAVIAITIAFRRLLKRGFVPILLLLMIAWGFYVSGIFDQVTSFYLSRGLEESGRGLTLPLAIESILSAPLVGSGMESLLLDIPGAEQLVTPHNGIFHLAIAGGVVPAILFLAYWWRAAIGVVRARLNHLPDAPFLLPLLVFAFLEMMIIDYAFMSDWHMVVLGAASTAYVSHQTSAEPAGVEST